MNIVIRARKIADRSGQDLCGCGIATGHGKILTIGAISRLGQAQREPSGRTRMPDFVDINTDYRDQPYAPPGQFVLGPQHDAGLTA